MKLSILDKHAHRHAYGSALRFARNVYLEAHGSFGTVEPDFLACAHVDTTIVRTCGFSFSERHPPFLFEYTDPPGLLSKWIGKDAITRQHFGEMSRLAIAPPKHIRHLRRIDICVLLAAAVIRHAAECRVHTIGYVGEAKLRVGFIPNGLMSIALCSPQLEGTPYESELPSSYFQRNPKCYIVPIHSTDQVEKNLHGVPVNYGMP